MRLWKLEMEKLYKNQMILLMVFVFLVINTGLFYMDYSKTSFQEAEIGNENDIVVHNIENYAVYLEEIQEKGEGSQISIFQSGDEYVEKNNQKTARDFLHLEGTELTMTNYRTFSESTESEVTSIFIVVILCYGVVLLLMEESSIFPLIHTLKCGERRYMLGKILALFGLVIGVSILFWGSNHLLSLIVYGGIDYNVPIQSIPNYYTSNLNVSIGEMLLVLFGTRVLIYTLIVLVVYFIVLKLLQMQKIIMVIGSIIVLELFLKNLPGQGTIAVLLRNLNLVQLLSPHYIYGQYYNVSIGREPINLLVLCVIAVLLMIIIFFSLNVMTFSTNSNNKIKEKRVRNKKVRVGHSLIYHEGYKFLIDNKGMWIFIVFSGLIIARFQTTVIGIEQNERYYQEYIDRFGGEVTETTIAAIKDEVDSMNQYRAELELLPDRYENGEIGIRKMQSLSAGIVHQLEKEPALMRVQEQMKYLTSEVETPVLVDELGYLELANHGYVGKSIEIINVAIYVVFAILLYIRYFAYEYTSGVTCVATCYPRGGKVVWKYKVVYIVIAHTLIFIGIWLSMYWRIVSSYGIENGQALAENIESYKGVFMNRLTLNQALLVIYSIRYILTAACGGVLCVVACKIKEVTKAIFVAIIAFLIPICLYMVALWG